MSSTHRRDNPSRSAADVAPSSSRNKNYRFKSYLEANTQERARFDAMQDHVPDKIAEVIASFREDKLVVQPSRPRPAEVMPEPELALEVTPPVPVESPQTRIIASSRAHQPRVMWPYYVGALVVALGVMIWLDASADAPAESATATAAAPAAGPVTGSIAPAAPAVAAPVKPVAAAPAPAKTAASSSAAPSTSSAPAKSAGKSDKVGKPQAAAGKSTKAAAARKPAHKAGKSTSDGQKEDAHYYSEDLTGLLQGN